MGFKIQILQGPPPPITEHAGPMGVIDNQKTVIFISKPDELVKADDWKQPGLLPVLKLNTVIEVPTGIYTYRQMVSVFFHRATLQNIKETLTSHEWCGNSFKELLNFNPHHSFRAHTYWDGMGEVTHPLPNDPALVFYDAG